MLILAAVLAAASPAADALARGDFETARRLAAPDDESAFVEATVALAEGRVDDAARAGARFAPGSPQALELSWRVAHARKEPAAIAAAARRLCAAGDPTGRACADAELYGALAPTPQVALTAATSLALSPTAPLPALAVKTGPVATGAVLDTGASQTVISSSLAQRLGLRTTQSSFPIAVAAGAGATRARLAVLPDLVVGGAHVTSLPVLVVDLPDLDRVGVSMVLSPQQAFDGLRVELDLARHALSLSPCGAVDPQAQPYYLAGFDLAVKASVGGGPPALFGVDTGLAAAVAVSSSYQRGAPTGPSSPAPDGASMMMHGAGGSASVAGTGALAVRAGDVDFGAAGPCVVSDVAPGRVFRLAGFLGNALWQQGRIVLDTRAHRVSFLPR